MTARLRTILILFILNLISGCGPLGSGSPWDALLGPPAVEHYQTEETELSLPLSSGETVSARVWNVKPWPARGGILFVTGIDGGFLEPADGIYTRIARALARDGIASAFVQYRNPGILESCLEDARAGTDYLKSMGANQLAAVGFSFGGAVITHSAVQLPGIVTLVGFAPQSQDTEPAAHLSPSQSLLLIHSRADLNVPYEASEEILNTAPHGIQKKLVTLELGDHEMNGSSDTVFPVVLSWLKRGLGLDTAAE